MSSVLWYGERFLLWAGQALKSELFNSNVNCWFVLLAPILLVFDILLLNLGTLKENQSFLLRLICLVPCCSIEVWIPLLPGKPISAVGWPVLDRKQSSRNVLKWQKLIRTLYTSHFTMFTGPLWRPSPRRRAK